MVMGGLFLAASLAFTLLQAGRNDRVFAFRQRLLDEMQRAILLDCMSGLVDYQWRFDAYHAVSYDRMLWQFWRRLDAFYPDRRFTRPR